MRYEFTTRAQVEAVPDPKQISWHIDRFVVLTGDDMVQDTPPAQPASISVSPRQFRQALTRAGLRGAVEAAVKAADQDTKDWYEFSSSFESDHPVALVVAEAIGKTRADVDALFALAATL